jgi:hypothetical protein
MIMVNHCGLWKNEFEKVLGTWQRLGRKVYSFVGNGLRQLILHGHLFLNVERYAGQLPSLHDGMNPTCERSYPHLER